MKTTNVQPFDGPEFDTPPEHAVARTLTYVVCSTPRSGSGLLCRAIAGTGVAGTPTEYFNPPRRSMLSRRWGCGPGLAAYTAALGARRTSRTGVFGTKLHWHQVVALRAEMLGRRHAAVPFDQPASLVEELVGDAPAYVRIARQDVHRQAVSLWTAEQTGVWGRGELPAGERRPRLRYSFAGIRRALARIALGELHWERFFRSNAITPIEVLYEELSADYESVVAGVLDRLVPGHEAVAIPAPVTGRQSDTRSERHLARFLEDLGERHPLSLAERVVPRARGMLSRW
jgi:LPS sulfotransferase NodH